MTTSSQENSVRLPARDIPVPASLSPEAQAIMAMAPPGNTPYPALNDIQGWRAMAAETDEQIVQMMSERASQVPADVEERDSMAYVFT